MAPLAGAEVAVTRTGTEVGAGAFDVVGAEVLVFGAAVVVVVIVGAGAGAPDPACRSVESTVGPGDGVGPAAFDAVVGAADDGVRTGVAELGTVEAGARGMGGANELGGARGIGGASGLAVVTGAAANEVVGLAVATGAVASGAVANGAIGDGLVDDDGFATDGEVMTTVAIGAGATVTGGRIELSGTEAESTGNLTAVCPGGTETTESVTRGSVGTGAVGTGTVGAGVVGAGAAGTAIGGKSTGLIDGATVALATGTVVETWGTADGALLPTGKAGAPDPACRSVKGTVRPGDEVGPAAFDTVARGAATMTGAASCPTPTRGTAGPEPAPASTTPPAEVLSTAEEAAAGTPGPDDGNGAMVAPAWTGATGATGAAAETCGAGAMGVAATDEAPLAGGRSRA